MSDHSMNFGYESICHREPHINITFVPTAYGPNVTLQTVRWVQARPRAVRLRSASAMAATASTTTTARNAIHAS